MLARSRSFLYADPLTDHMTGYVDHHILGAATFQTDYQIPIRVYRGYGSNSGQNVYIPPSELNSNYNDLRFADDTGRILPHCVETQGTNYQDVWVKVPNIPTAGCVIRVLFGAGNIVSGNNAAAGILYDHFSGATLDSTKWSQVGSPTSVAVADSICTVTQNAESWAGIKSASNYGPYNLALLTLAKYSNICQAGFSNVDDMYTSADVANWLFFSAYNQYYGRTGHNGTLTNNAISMETSNYHRDEIRWISGSVKHYRDNSLVASSTTNLPTVACYLYSLTWSTYTIKTDMVLLRKYTDPEPSHGWWGSLEDF